MHSNIESESNNHVGIEETYISSEWKCMAGTCRWNSPFTRYLHFFAGFFFKFDVCLSVPLDKSTTQRCSRLILKIGLFFFLLSAESAPWLKMVDCSEKRKAIAEQTQVYSFLMLGLAAWCLGCVMVRCRFYVCLSLSKCTYQHVVCSGY